MTIMELLEWGKHTLKSRQDPAFAHLSSPALDAEVLLAHALNLTKPQVFSRLNTQVSPTQESTYHELIERRLQHEPVAYITGKKFFYSRPFAVNRHVLIPRPETEHLVDEALRMFHLYEEHRQPVRFIDVGTGSGTIALTLAAETHKQVIATDLSPHALAVAKENAASLHVADQITFAEGNLLEPILPLLSQKPPEHTIVCANLPYLTTRQWENAQPDVRDFEPKLALEAGYYGLDAYWVLFRQLLGHRRLFGASCVTLCEIDPGQETKLPHLILEHAPDADVEVLKDLQGLPRVVRAILS